MKCSKCGFDNPEDALFCEKCDWKLGETYIPEVKVNRTIFSYIALAVGIIAIIPAILQEAVIVSIIFGGIGLVLGGYSFNIPRLTNAPNKNLLMALSAIGLILSVFAFIYGIYLMVD
jgi:uncharacterized membrane protein YvbJ